MTKTNQKELQAKFQGLLRKLNLQTSRVPGYTEIILKAMAQPLEARIRLLEIILNWLEVYPDMEFVGLSVTNRAQTVRAINDMSVPFSVQYGLKVRYKCKDCEKITEEEGYPLVPGIFRYDARTETVYGSDAHLVCKECHHSYEEPDYEPDEDFEGEREEWEIKQKKDNFYNPN